MQFEWSTFALQTVNFAVLVWLLHRFLYRPVLRLVDARRAEIDRQFAEARAADAMAAAQLASVESERAGIAAERAATLKQAAAEAETAAEARRARAEREASEIIEAGRTTLAAERVQARAEARRLALDLGADVAARLLAEMPLRLRAEAWLARIEEYLAGLPTTEREGLGQQLAHGMRLNVVTATALPDDMAALWRDRLERVLGDHLALDFAVNPALVAGVELHFPNAVLRFSWESALAAMRAEIEADGHTG
jgi:F-type H+-transporting ATPase subunit b